ncbi:FAD:protein FMN transferase [Hydrogenophaga palleronii]|uniref:FAD:protein FMN transferase n=1 Tax=Hydrogenophaga palleronii TaxID=65655 RepID=UPI0008266097|nr:FAD:protein FMN transferase [Hydrogenophaga palleronii]
MIASGTTIPDRFVFDAIGTRWAIEAPRSIAPPLRQSILARAEAFDATWSRFREDSLVSEIARAERGGRFLFPEEASRLFDLYDGLHAATAGAVDPLVGRDLEMLGYDRHYSLVPVPMTERAAYRRPRWTHDVSRQGCVLTCHGPLVIDVGAAGKGLLIDLIGDLLRGAGLSDHLIDASGDLLQAGDSALAVGLEDPRQPGHVIGLANLEGRALCASATNRRRWGEGVHHILDARTGVPAQHVMATWVVADNAMTADGLATALFFVEPSRLAATGPFEFVRLFSDGRAEWSAGFEGEVFI